VLYRLGRYAFDHPLRILGVWLLVIAAVVGLLVTQPRVISSGLTLDDTPSQRVMDSISEAMPQAQGTQGSLVFTSADGARIDSPERAAAVVAALSAARDTGFVVDRDGKLEDQRAEVGERIREQVEIKVAAELAPQLAALGSSLDAAAAAVPTDQPDASDLVARLDELADRARTLSTATPGDQVDGSTVLFADLQELTLRLEAAGAAQALTLQAPSGEMSDPRARVDEAVAEATTAALADPEANRSLWAAPPTAASSSRRTDARRLRRCISPSRSPTCPRGLSTRCWTRSEPLPAQPVWRSRQPRHCCRPNRRSGDTRPLGS
jgi:RND superfamily putative drug exporter